MSRGCMAMSVRAAPAAALRRLRDLLRIRKPRLLLPPPMSGSTSGSTSVPRLQPTIHTRHQHGGSTAAAGGMEFSPWFTTALPLQPGAKQQHIRLIIVPGHVGMAPFVAVLALEPHLARQF